MSKLLHLARMVMAILYARHALSEPDSPSSAQTLLLANDLGRDARPDITLGGLKFSLVFTKIWNDRSQKQQKRITAVTQYISNLIFSKN
jgi:hypothetical protein